MRIAPGATRQLSMGPKEFSKELADLVQRAVTDGVHQQRLSFAQIVGTLEMTKFDVIAYAGDLAAAVAAKNEQEQRPAIIVPGIQLPKR